MKREDLKMRVGDAYSGNHKASEAAVSAKGLLAKHPAAVEKPAPWKIAEKTLR